MDNTLGSQERNFPRRETAGPAHPDHIFVELMSEGAVALTEKGTILYANKRFARMLGMAPETLAGASFYDIALPFEHHAAVDNLIARSLLYDADTVVSCTASLKLRGSKVFPVDLSVARVERGGTNTLCMIVKDTGERKPAKSPLPSVFEVDIRTLIEHSPDIIFRLDTAQRCIFVNSAIERYLGAPAGSYIGATFEKMGFNGECRRQFEEALATGEERTLEFTLPANGGTKYFFSRLIPERSERGADGTIVSLLGIMNDVTGLKLKEQQLIALNDLYRKAKEEYQRLIDTANSVILRWAPDGTLKFINDFGLDFFGYTKKDLMGKSLQFLFPGTDLGDLARRIFGEPERFFGGEKENVKKNGERAWITWTYKAITGEDGELKEILAIGNDVTALKRTQEELHHHKEELETLVNKRTQELFKTHAELERTRRMADIGRLASTIAHELRNPLSGIKTAAYNIQRKSDAALLGKHIETINKKVHESDLIINNLLGFTRIKTLLHEPFNLREAVRDCVAGVSAKYAKWNVAVTEDFTVAPEDIIEADLTQVCMLISNLLDNAFQALPDKAGQVSVAVSRHGTQYRIAVTDNGAGIADEEKEKIFEPFYTTKSKGTGLGLTVCREIVDLHGGKIHVSSLPGKGTTFAVTLPASRSGANA